jgi:ribose transport system permease protein
MQSLQPKTLKPAASGFARISNAQRLRRLIPVYGLPLLTLGLIVLFSILLPDSFPTALNARSILSDKAVIALLSLAATLPMIAGRIDLTVGYGIVLWNVAAISLQVTYGIDWRIAVAVTMVGGVVVGLINGVLVEIAQIDSFIATLGTGTILYAFAAWHTGGQQIVGVLAHGFTAINATWIAGLPIGAVYVLILAVVLWLVTERTPLGRHLYAIGANPEAAALNGIPVRAYVIGAFVASGFITAFAGVVLASRLRIAESSVGLDYLLPALVGAFLGSTTIKPGRPNVWGTLVGVLILAVGISGIQQFGAAFFVEPLFNGATLIIAIGIAGYAQRRRSAVHRSTDPG